MCFNDFSFIQRSPRVILMSNWNPRKTHLHRSSNLFSSIFIISCSHPQLIFALELRDFRYMLFSNINLLPVQKNSFLRKSPVPTSFVLMVQVGTVWDCGFKCQFPEKIFKVWLSFMSDPGLKSPLWGRINKLFW